MLQFRRRRITAGIHRNVLTDRGGEAEDGTCAGFLRVACIGRSRLEVIGRTGQQGLGQELRDRDRRVVGSRL